jgi:hypothetical protein
VSSARACIHGHFYQPPRENPWTGLVDQEENAAPDHDWNARITRECYRPLAGLGAYERLSFDCGPTLLDWLEREAEDVYEAILSADRTAVRRTGYGNALATPYHHVILPLCDRRDKETEVRWGIADFKRRFGRDPAGFWLPETAVDRESLDVVAAEGIQFTVLAPHQVTPAPHNGWSGRIELNEGRSIAVFVYDGPLSHDIAFGPLVSNADAWVAALEQRGPGSVTTMAVDGETFGHHHKGGDRVVSTVLERLGDRATNLDAVQADDLPAEILKLNERTSWSCVHGIERWRGACGCRIHHDRPSQQDWRAPLRSAVDWLAHEVHALYEREGASLPGGPWAFRDAAGAVADGAGDARTERLIDMERGVLRSMTSCGWFFDDIAGLEGRQVLRYAAHAIGLAGDDSARLAAGFIQQLGAARSNDPAAGSAADIFRQYAEQGDTANR